MSWASWLFPVEGFFQDALHKVLQLEAVLAGVDLEAAVEVGRDFESRCWDWWWWSGCHGVKINYLINCADAVVLPFVRVMVVTSHFSSGSLALNALRVSMWVV